VVVQLSSSFATAILPVLESAYFKILGFVVYLFLVIPLFVYQSLPNSNGLCKCMSIVCM